MDEFNELSSYEYNRVIEAMTEQIQSLTVELASVLCDVSRCLPEDEKEDGIMNGIGCISKMIWKVMTL